MHTSIEDLKENVEQLKSRYGALKQNNISLLEEVKELQKNLEEKHAEVESMNHKLKLVKMSKSLENSEKNTDVKLKINELVREIDRCIALLNK